jgi:hypothetical protein
MKSQETVLVSGQVFDSLCFFLLAFFASVGGPLEFQEATDSGRSSIPISNSLHFFSFYSFSPSLRSSWILCFRYRSDGREMSILSSGDDIFANFGPQFYENGLFMVLTFQFKSQN